MIRSRLYVFCDAPDCPNQVVRDGRRYPQPHALTPEMDRTYAQTADEAARLGWTRRGQRDFCPECSRGSE